MQRNQDKPNGLAPNKKFAAFIISEILLFALMGLVTFKQDITWAVSFFLSFAVVGACALAIGFVLSEKSLEHFMDEIGSIRGGEHGKDEEPT